MSLIKQKVLLALLLLGLTASSSFAGKIAVRNYNGDPYRVIYEGRVVGIACTSSFVINKDEYKVEDFVINTIENIKVYLCGDDVPMVTCPVLEPDKVYTVSGTPMAHRKFTVIIESSGTIQVGED